MKIISATHPELVEFCRSLSDRDLWALLSALQTELLDRAMSQPEVDEFTAELERLTRDASPVD